MKHINRLPWPLVFEARQVPCLPDRPDNSSHSNGDNISFFFLLEPFKPDIETCLSIRKLPVQSSCTTDNVPDLSSKGIAEKEVIYALFMSIEDTSCSVFSSPFQ
jgi:hypothetical protein